MRSESHRLIRDLPAPVPHARNSRRRVLAAALGLGLLTARPVRGDAAQSGTPIAEGSWSFTDDHGTTVTLPALPRRIVAHVGSAATLWDYGIRPVGVFGSLRREDGSKDPLAGNIDLDAVITIGEGWSEVDLEALVALQPDLIVGTTYSPDIAEDLWGLEPDIAASVMQIAPAVAISVFETSVTESLSRFEELAAALGADLGAPTLVAARERFAQASEDVRQAAAKPGLTVLVMSAWPEAIYVANPAAASDLTYFQELGVNLIVPTAPDAYWEELSWELALKYPADVILLDERDGGFTVATVDEAPSTLAAHSAVKAGQLGNWYTEFVLSYDAFAAVLEELAATIREARVLGDRVMGVGTEDGGRKAGVERAWKTFLAATAWRKNLLASSPTGRSSSAAGLTKPWPNSQWLKGCAV